jgi:hypothetical protein
MEITFERSGGIMGRKAILALNLDEIPAEEAEGLRLLLAEANFFSLADDLPTDPVPDGFLYTITVGTDKITHTIHATDMSASPSLRALIQDLSTRVRTKRKPS